MYRPVCLYLILEPGCGLTCLCFFFALSPSGLSGTSTLAHYHDTHTRTFSATAAQNGPRDQAPHHAEELTQAILTITISGFTSSACPWIGLPRKLVTGLVEHTRPVGCLQMTGGRACKKALMSNDPPIDFNKWCTAGRRVWQRRLGKRDPCLRPTPALRHEKTQRAFRYVAHLPLRILLIQKRVLSLRLFVGMRFMTTLMNQFRPWLPR